MIDQRLQQVELTLSNGKTGWFSGSVLIEESESAGVLVTGVRFTHPRALPDGLRMESLDLSTGEDVAARAEREDVCDHTKTTFIDDPMDPDIKGSIELCADCGMSRSHWEQGESSWQRVDLSDCPFCGEFMEHGHLCKRRRT
jgi:hypothetical protein